MIYIPPPVDFSNKAKPPIFAVDFDGTCVTHAYPVIGIEIGAAKVLRRITANGGLLILHTMRSGDTLDDAIKWFTSHNIPLWAAQRNPEQNGWTTSPKCYAHHYIDDAALGCPLTFNRYLSERPFVNWAEVEAMIFGNA